mgnify:CR=1 FL=1
MENEVNMMARRQQKLSLKRFFDGWVLRVKEWVKKKAYYDDFVYFYEENAMKSTLKLFSLYSRQRKKIREAKRLLEGILLIIGFSSLHLKLIRISLLELNH